MDELIKNDFIKIFRTQNQDIAFVVDAERQQENAGFIIQWTYEQHEAALNDEDVLHLLIKDTKNQNIGYAILKGMVNPNDSVEFMRIVITAKGFGYGKQAISLLTKWCFEEKKAHRLWLDVKENNVRAQHVYQSLGFIQEGVLRECLKSQGKYQSLMVMSILSHEYQDSMIT